MHAVLVKSVTPRGRDAVGSLRIFPERWGIRYDQALVQINNTYMSYRTSPPPVNSYRSLITQVGGAGPILQRKDLRLSLRKFKKCAKGQTEMKPELWSQVFCFLMPFPQCPGQQLTAPSMPGTGLRRQCCNTRIRMILAK